MITYSDLYEALRKEKYGEKLQKLSRNFLSQVESYFKEKYEIIKGSDEGMFNDELAKTKKQIENAKSIVNEMMMLRQKKILNLALVAARIGIDKKDIENMLDSEKELLEDTTSKLEKSRQELEIVFRGEKKKDMKNQMIRFMQDVPKFLSGENSIGPFKKGDVANLPKEIVSILIQGKQADIIEEN